MSKIKKTIIIVIVVSIMCLIGLYIVHSNKVIGEYYGSEYDYIRIGNDIYKFDADNPYISSERGIRLGRVVSQNDSSDESMYIWSVKGTDEYIYRVWGLYDGGFYRKVE